jgi:FAD/FMN-containing dehydrogenase
VAAQEAALRDLGAVRPVPADVWQRFADTDPPEPVTAVRISQRVARMAEVWEEALGFARDLPNARVHATLDRGVARVVLPEISEDDLEHRVAEQAQRAATCVFEVLPAGLWSRLAPSGVVDPLSRRVRAAFDPERRLNPGILGDA